MERMLIVCAALVAAVDPGWAQGAPAWVGRRPQVPGQIAGIGSAPLRGDLAQARRAARQEALGEIAAQLSVDISREDRARAVEGLGVSRRYEAATTQRLAARLEGVRIVDTWAGAGYCWVYAVLDEEAYGQRRRARSERSRALARAGLEQVARGRVVQGLAAIARARASAPTGTDGGREESAAALRQVVSRLVLRADPGEGTVQLTAGGAPVDDMPLLLEYAAGARIAQVTGFTSAAGKLAFAPAPALAGSTQVRLLVRIDWQALVPDGEGMGDWRAGPEVSLLGLAPPPRVYIEPLAGSQRMADAIGQSLVSGGFAVVGELGAAGWRLQLRRVEREWPPANGLYFARVEWAVQLQVREGGRGLARVCGAKGAGSVSAAALGRARDEARAECGGYFAKELSAHVRATDRGASQPYRWFPRRTAAAKAATLMHDNRKEE